MRFNFAAAMSAHRFELSFYAPSRVALKMALFMASSLLLLPHLTFFTACAAWMKWVQLICMPACVTLLTLADGNFLLSFARYGRDESCSLSTCWEICRLQ
jgi:hypothetical protein